MKEKDIYRGSTGRTGSREKVRKIRNIILNSYILNASCPGSGRTLRAMSHLRASPDVPEALSILLLAVSAEIQVRIRKLRRLG